MQTSKLSEQHLADVRSSGPTEETVAAAGVHAVSLTQTPQSAIPLARNSKCAFLELPPATHPPDPWTVHSLAFFLPGPHRGEALAALQAFTPTPMIFDRRWTDRQTGEIVTLSHLVRFDFADPENAALLPLGKVAASLERFPWAAYPSLRVNRIDLASDHLVSPSPREVCDRIAGLRLPYSRPYRGPQDAKDPWLTMYHNGGKTRAPGVVVVHYPRLESLLHRHSEAGPAAVRYAAHRVRQEIRFRGQGIRRRVGGGSMTPEVVFGSFPALVQFAERRLRPVFEAGILSPPSRDLAGEAALASAVELRAAATVTGDK